MNGGPGRTSRLPRPSHARSGGRRHVQGGHGGGHRRERGRQRRPRGCLLCRLVGPPIPGRSDRIFLPTLTVRHWKESPPRWSPSSLGFFLGAYEQVTDETVARVQWAADGVLPRLGARPARAVLRPGRVSGVVPGNDPLRRRGRRRRVLYSWGRLQREPMKCEIVCANCHRVRSCRRSLASLPGGNGKGRRRKAA